MSVGNAPPREDGCAADIPSVWVQRSVGAMGNVVTGKALAATAPGRLRPYLRTRNVFDGRIDLADVLEMPMTDEEFERFQVLPGDALLNEGQSIELVGRCAMYRGELGSPCAMQNQLVRFRAKSGVSSAFAVHLFRHCQQTGVFGRIALQTTSIAHLGGKRFERLVLGWPPTEGEQDAIAEALSETDDLIASLDLLLRKKRDVAQGVQQALLSERVRLTGFAGAWMPRPLGSIARCLRGVTYAGDADLAPDDTAATRRLLRANNVQNARIVLEGLQHVNAARVRPEQILRLDDILICMANGSKALVGKAGRFLVSDGYDYTFGAFMACLRADPDRCSPSFVYYLLQTQKYRDEIAILLAGSTINNLRPSAIEGLEFRIPTDPVEQAAIAAVLSDLDAELEALEARRAKTLAIKQGMMQALLTGRIRLK